MPESPPQSSVRYSLWRRDPCVISDIILESDDTSEIIGIAQETRQKNQENGVMPVLRVALAQVDVTVGDFAGNAAVILDRTAEACAAGAYLVLFPELAVTGYPPEDLVFRS